MVLFHQDNAPSHKSLVTMAAFELLRHPPYSQDLTPSDFRLFPKLKEHLQELNQTYYNESVAVPKNCPWNTLPPQPVLTRWGTWLNAVNYYAEHYGKIMEVIDALDSTDSSAVAAVKSLPSEQILEDILFIDSNFKIVSKSITLLQSSKLEALNIADKVSQTVIQNNNSLISEKVKWEDLIGTHCEPPGDASSVQGTGETTHNSNEHPVPYTGDKALSLPRRKLNYGPHSWEANTLSTLTITAFRVTHWDKMTQRSTRHWGGVTYGAEAWTLRRSEEKRIEAFEMWVWRRMERVKRTNRIRIEAVLERVEYYSKIMEVIDVLDSTDSSAVAAVKSLPSEQLLEDILFIDSNFKIVSKSITLLESSELQLSEALNIVDKVSQIVIQNITNFRKSEITISSQFTVLLAQSLEFTVSRTTDLQRQSTVLELRSLQLRSTALELRPSDADTVAEAHSSRTPKRAKTAQLLQRGEQKQVGKSGCDVGKRTVPVRKYDSILKALSSLENANIFLERTILSNSVLLTICGLGSVWSWNFLSRRGGSEVHSKTQQEDRDITYTLFCSVLCIMEQVSFDEILILSVQENPHVYDKRRTSYKDEKMKNTWLSIAASLNTDQAVMLKVKPIFRDLADKKLVEKCTSGCTQNPNESFNNSIWERLPKTVFVGLNVLKTGVLDAVITFNDGSSSRKKVLELMDIKPGFSMEHELYAIEVRRVKEEKYEYISRERERERENSLDVEEAASISNVKSVLSSDIYGSLAFLKSNFSDFPKYTEYLESSSLQLKDAISVIDSLLQKQVPGPMGEAVTLQLKEVLQKIPRLRVFENKVLRKIFGAKRDEVTGEWRKLHNIELHALYSSPDIIRTIKSRRLRWAGHVARMGESRNAYRVLVGRPEGKRPLGRPRRRWEDNIKMDLREVEYDREWINLAQDRDRWRAYVRAAMNLRVP
ncbi:hypothetical protein ANN_05702 [Periplaneta americana]|uniref:Uncharacterized protein n=1 Tax=Periplaneta americana TaxID=6978 RepID=A0ABQ8TDK1_PERAM|nr:hypothetical protein ANN_05702 [Periplaneta americana]